MGAIQKAATLFFAAVMLAIIVIKSPKDKAGATGIEQTGYAAESFGTAGANLARGIYGG